MGSVIGHDHLWAGQPRADEAIGRSYHGFGAQRDGDYWWTFSFGEIFLQEPSGLLSLQMASS